jgi:adenylyl-sulfate kinase
MSDNIFPVNSKVSPTDREKLFNQKAVVVWLTGLSGSGKTTIGIEVERKLIQASYHAYLLDGDSLRTGLNSDLGFSMEDRNENIRRAGEICKLMTGAGLIVITTFISPLRSQRNAIRSQFEKNQFIEVFVDTPLQICEERDVKGLYKKARAGELKNFTGIDSPYEEPLSPEFIIKTDGLTETESVEKLMTFLLRSIVV